MAEKLNVEDVADLACLKINEADIPQFEKHFEKVLQHFEHLSKVDTAGVAPMVTPHDKKSSLREDKVVQDLSLSELLDNAPEVKDAMFKVPPVV